jgi:hypothetical protein
MEYKDLTPMMKFTFLVGYYVTEDKLRFSSGAQESFTDEEIAEIETAISNKEPGDEKDLQTEILARMKEIRSSC